MKEIKLLGSKTIAGKSIHIIEGGFGEGQKCILASDVAIEHELRMDKINSLINSNIERFNQNDLMDFLKPSEGLRNFAKENGLITNNRTKNIYLLSERGYIKLVSMMDNNNEKKWEVMNQIIDEYFSMREELKTISDIDRARLNILKAETDLERTLALKEYEEIVVKPIQEKADYADKVLLPTDKNFNKLLSANDIAKDLGISARKLNQILHDKNIIYKKGKTWFLYSKHQDKIPEYADYHISEFGQTLKWTEKGRKWILEIIEVLATI